MKKVRRNQIHKIKQLRALLNEWDLKQELSASKLMINESLTIKILDALPINIFLEDREGHTIFANEQACRANGKTLEELIGKTVYDFFPPEIARINREDDLRVWKEKKLITKEGIAGFKGKESHMFTGKTVIHSEELDEDFLLGFGLDISDRIAAEKQIEYMAYHDALTGLPNRWYIQDKLRGHISNIQKKDRLGVFLLDLDHFKVINDSFGHQAGDKLLQQVAERLQLVSSVDTAIGRLGGDEFILLQPNVTSPADVLSFSNKIKEIIEEPFLIDGNKLNVTASIGICLCPDDGDQINTLLKYADLAMYRSKENGRNCSTLFNPVLQAHADERMGMEIDLRRAIDRKEFVLHYQPKFDLRIGGISGFEALIRWKKGEGELLYPDAFISIAEETGLIVPIGEWVIFEAARQCKKWHDSGHNHLSVSINLSPKQFQKQDLEAIIARALADTGLPASSLELELTEHMIMKDPEEAVLTLKRLKALGVTLSIDDFGTGFSSLSYLQHFPIDILKIDKSFTFNLENDEANAAIVSAVITLAHSLHLQLVAEGVENAEQLKFLQHRACDLAQGYAIARPMEGMDVENFLAASLQHT